MALFLFLRVLFSKEFLICARTNTRSNNTLQTPTNIAQINSNVQKVNKEVTDMDFSINTDRGPVKSTGPDGTHRMGAIPLRVSVSTRQDTTEWQNAGYNIFTELLKLYWTYLKVQKYDTGPTPDLMTIYLLVQKTGSLLSYNKNGILFNVAQQTIPTTSDVIVSATGTISALSIMLVENVVQNQDEKGRRYYEHLYESIGPFPEYRAGLLVTVVGKYDERVFWPTGPVCPPPECGSGCGCSSPELMEYAGATESQVPLLHATGQDGFAGQLKSTGLAADEERALSVLENGMAGANIETGSVGSEPPTVDRVYVGNWLKTGPTPKPEESILASTIRSAWSVVIKEEERLIRKMDGLEEQLALEKEKNRQMDWLEEQLALEKEKNRQMEQTLVRSRRAEDEVIQLKQQLAEERSTVRRLTAMNLAMADKLVGQETRTVGCGPVRSRADSV